MCGLQSVVFVLIFSFIGLSPSILAEQAPSRLFPAWQADQYQLELYPLMGFRSRTSRFDGEKTQLVSTEFGLGGALRGFPLWGANPGIRLRPYGLYTWGHRSETLDEEAFGFSESSSYNRRWAGLQSRFYYHSFRYTLDVGQGGIDYHRYFTDVKGFQIAHDFGVLILPWLSGHYTLRDMTFFETKRSESTIHEMDHWLHVRWFWSLFDFYIDAGPGISQLTIHEWSDEGERRRLGSGQTNYLKSLASIHLFWKLGLQVSMKYIVSAKETVADGLVYDQLPNQALNEPTLLNTLPSGSSESIWFFGLRDVFVGFGLGWQYRTLSLNYDDDRGRQVYRDQGWVLAYESPM